jgi:prepilin-type N-terminal cleavage/methylation domain-containing protein
MRSIVRPQRRSRAGFSLVELLVASMLMLIIMGAVATLFGEFGKSVADGRAMSDLGARTRNVAWRLRQDLAGLTCNPAPFVPVEAGAGYLTADGASDTAALPFPNSAPFPPITTDYIALTTTSRGAPFRGRIKELSPVPTYTGFEVARGLESPTAEVVWFVEPSVIFKNRQLYDLHRRQLLVAATPEAGVFRNDVFASPGLPGESDLSYGTWPVGAVVQHANSLGDLTKPDRRLIARNRSQWRFTDPDPTQPTPATPDRPLTDPPGGPNRKGEDVILRNVLYFDVRIATQSGTIANTYPLAYANSTFDTLPNSALAASPPLRALEVTIVCLEPTTNEERVITVVHSFGQERTLFSEP